MLSRGLVRAGGKVLVAASAASALGNDNSLIGTGKVVDPLAGCLVIDNGAHRNLEHDTLAIAAGAVGAFAVASAIARVFRIKAEVDQCVVALAGFHYNFATVAAISAVGASTL